MADYLVSRNSFNASGDITKADAYDIQAAAVHAAKAVEVAKIANIEMAAVAGHATGVTANLVSGAQSITHHLLAQGVRSEIFDDARDKVLTVTAQNLITITNVAQKEIAQAAASAMRS